MSANQLGGISRTKFLVNALGFNIIWALLVIIRDPWTHGVALLFLALHFLFMPQADEARRVTIVMIIGTLIDGILTHQGWFIFTPEVPWIPAWLILLWACFGCTLEHSLRWAMKQTPVAMLLGAIAGPLSYFAGYRFGAVEFGHGLWLTLGLLSVIWALLMGGLSRLYAHFGWLEAPR
ncbi:MAG: DUF2878 domain-containing protein [Pseudomonadales bacterium]|jgi:hypothetical protein